MICDGSCSRVQGRCWDGSETLGQTDEENYMPRVKNCQGTLVLGRHHGSFETSWLLRNIMTSKAWQLGSKVADFRRKVILVINQYINNFISFRLSFMNSWLLHKNCNKYNWMIWKYGKDVFRNSIAILIANCSSSRCCNHLFLDSWNCLLSEHLNNIMKEIKYSKETISTI